MNRDQQFAAFLRGYTAALYWSSSDEWNGETVNLDEFEASTAAGDKCRADCLAFFEANYADLCAAAKLECEPSLIRAIWKAPDRATVETLYPAAADLDRGYQNPYKLRELKRAAVDHAGGFHGVEYLGRDRRTGDSVYYCNAGDPYAAALCFIGTRLVVCDWAYWVESGRVKG